MKLATLLIIALSTLATAAKPAHSVNVNTAPADSLASALPGVGQAIAARIVAARPFRTCQDLTENVVGIGAKRIDKICPLLVF